jgi:fumarate reductase flavoprotein subunit
MPASLKDGTYTSAPAQGMFGTITATVTISGGKITAVSEENEMETPYVGQYAMDAMVKEMVAKNTVQVDGVAGATSSSNGLRTAVEDCLKQAAN